MSNKVYYKFGKNKKIVNKKQRKKIVRKMKIIDENQYHIVLLRNLF